jgi:hypothetical protein
VSPRPERAVPEPGEGGSPTSEGRRCSYCQHGKWDGWKFRCRKYGKWVDVYDCCREWRDLEEKEWGR